jgi:hypothetical protein
VRFLELWIWNGLAHEDLRISAVSELPPPSLVTTAKGLAQLRLPGEAQSGKHSGLGFIIVHEGANADYASVDWWFDNDILQHHPYGAPKGQGGKLRYRWPNVAGFCVWELAVCWYEREAWVKHVLRQADKPDIEGYLAERMTADK